MRNEEKERDRKREVDRQRFLSIGRRERENRERENTERQAE